MERKGVYRKGRQGHVRNINSYQLFRQKFKKWRMPLTGLLALILVFGTAPIVGDEFQASLLIADDTPALVEQNPQQARKVLLNALNSFIKDCEKFRMTQCVEHGNALIKDVVNSGDQLKKVLPAVEDFEQSFESELALNACKYDLRSVLVKTKSTKKELQKFLDRFGDLLASENLTNAAQLFDSVIVNLNGVVDNCASR